MAGVTAGAHMGVWAEKWGCFYWLEADPIGNPNILTFTGYIRINQAADDFFGERDDLTVILEVGKRVTFNRDIKGAGRQTAILDVSHDLKLSNTDYTQWSGHTTD